MNTQLEEEQSTEIENLTEEIKQLTLELCLAYRAKDKQYEKLKKIKEASMQDDPYFDIKKILEEK